MSLYKQSLLFWTCSSEHIDNTHNHSYKHYKKRDSNKCSNYYSKRSTHICRDCIVSILENCVYCCCVHFLNIRNYFLFHPNLFTAWTIEYTQPIRSTRKVTPKKKVMIVPVEPLVSEVTPDKALSTIELIAVNMTIKRLKL